MGNTSVQFFGKEKVLTAYRARGIECWSIWQGRDFMTCGGSDAELAAYLDMLKGSQGAYQLRVHKDVNDAEDIDDKSAFHGSFRFKMDGVPGSVGGVVVHEQPVVGTVMGAITKRIEERVAAKMEKFLDRLDDDEEKEDESIGGIIKGFLKNPEQLAGIIQGARALFGAPVPVPAMGNVSVTRAGSDAPTNKPAVQQVAAVVLSEEEEYGRLATAYDILKKADPAILQHLEKLASISTTNAQMFAMLLTSLDNMK